MVYDSKHLMNNSESFADALVNIHPLETLTPPLVWEVQKDSEIAITSVCRLMQAHELVLLWHSKENKGATHKL